MTENNSKIRISAKKLFLTYKNIHSELTLEHVLQELKKKKCLNEFNYILAKEKTHENAETNIYAILTREKKFQI